jgi:3-deoxy-manno-octulosonate cytidylyltransferase (CMP-KDO synthetase)
LSIIAIIPARMASSRYPGKPLKKISGLSMIEHVRRRVSLCGFLDDVIVATCDKEIEDEVARFDGKVVMTSSNHQSCVDRIAEAADRLGFDIVVNVQGDMPLIDPYSLEQLVAPLLRKEALMYTDLMAPIERESDLSNPNIVKVVVDVSGNALYYSRGPIPSFEKALPGGTITRYRQFGVNAFRKQSLQTFTNMPRTPLEKIESVDMLRLVENGFKVRMVSSSYPMIGVDTPEDLVQAEKLMMRDSILSHYM